MNGDESGESVDELLAAAYALDGPAANRELYARWAATYESGFIVDSGYRYHEQVARIFVEHCLPRVVHRRGADAAVVVDLGCGTGLGGRAVSSRARAVIDGVDISPEMLREAASNRVGDEPVYRHLIEADLTRPIPIDDGVYDAAFSVGTFTHGHVGPAAIHEVVRIVRPSGRVAIGINAAHYATAGFDATFQQLIDQGRITELHLIDVPIYDGVDMTDRDDVAHVSIFTVADPAAIVPD
jgi:SAM-dependent methyltransferase